MPFEAFIRIDGVEGDGSAAEQPGAIDVVSYHWGASRPEESGAPIVHDFSFVKRADAASPALFGMCCSGARAATAVFVARRPSGERREIVRYTFTDVGVVSVRPGGAAEARDDVPLEEVTLAFRKVVVDGWPAGGGEARRAGWDLEGGTPG